MAKNRVYPILGALASGLLLSVCFMPIAVGQDNGATASSAPAASAAGTYHLPAEFKIVCIGDSITQGRKGGGEKSPPTYSWRYPLWKLFVDNDIKADFVGSLKVGFNGDPNWADYKDKKFDRDHEGHWGWTTEHIAKELPGWIEKYTPDVALILLGSNDKAKVKGMETTIKSYTSIVETLRKKNPNVLILIGPPFQEWEPFPDMHKALDKLAGELNTEKSPVVVVDLSKGWVSKPDAKNTCTVDWVHPNERGDKMLAEKWFEALKPFLAK